MHRTGDSPLWTELLHDGELVEFVVHTRETLYQDRLVKMGWKPLEETAFTRRLTASPDVERIFANFTRHLETMILQSARLCAIEWELALETFIDRVSGTGVGWWLYGSGALAARGLDIVPGDLDFSVEDGRVVGEALDDLLVEPVTGMVGWIADSGGRAFHGALVEWLSGPHPTGMDPPHEQERAAAAHLERVQWRGRDVFVPKLEIQLAVATRRGLDDRCAMIRRALAGG